MCFIFLDIFELFVFKANVLLLFGWLAFYMDSRLGTTTTTGVFIVAAVTDWLDGYLARRVCVFIYFLRNVVAFRFLE